MNLALIVELGFLKTAESCHAQLTLRVVRKESRSKKHNRRIQYPSIGAKSQAFEKTSHCSRDERIQPPRRDGALSRMLDLRSIEVLYREPWTADSPKRCRACARSSSNR
jgi:hypothetical protein